MPPKKKSTAKKKAAGGKKPAPGVKGKAAGASAPSPPPPPDLSRAEAQKKALAGRRWWEGAPEAAGGEVAIADGAAHAQLVLTEHGVQRPQGVGVIRITNGAAIGWPETPPADTQPPSPDISDAPTTLPPIHPDPALPDATAGTTPAPLIIICWADGTAWHSAKREPVRGTVTLKFQHYKETATIEDGRVQNAVIDEMFAINYVYKNSTIRIGPSCLLSHDMAGYYEGLEPGGTYQVTVTEDPEEYAKYLANHKSLEFNDNGKGGGTTAAERLTKELKGLSAAEIAEGSDRYRELLEARDREDCLYS